MAGKDAGTSVAGVGVRNRTLLSLTIALPFAYLCVFYVYPIGRLVYLSLRDFSPGFGTDEYVGLANYVAILGSRAGWQYIGRTFLYTGVCVGASFTIGLMYGLITVTLAKRLSTAVGSLFRQIIVLPMIFVPAAASVMWTFAYTEHYGWVNHLLGAIHMPTYPWLVSDAAFYLVMVTDIWGWTPFMYLILLAGLQTLPQEPLEAARVDGATAWQTFWYVIMPLMRPVMLIALTIKTLDTYRAFDYLWVMTSGGPGESSTTLNLVTYKTAFLNLEFGKASAYGVVTMVFPLLVVNLFLFARRRV
jgi:multiple sugar transport system permease protein